ncbi:hypothetical protein [Nocardioides jiangxiensis]|uniref:PI-PLC Y-box domain-containing protein n=1 Tax=Nocardioides jiangxiensis TaxID=3064524 RepID=A0ABT9B0Z0_9ACTN|nr:hypothetical protein [Nocardioides sp. WY-20]MDO7868526.1 hypothetical protein [Nocardioides sp. WY-20]
MVPNPDQYSRAAKALTDSGLAGFDEAASILAASRPQLVLGADLVTGAHHIAALTVVQTAHRAFMAPIDVIVEGDVADSRCLTPGYSCTLAEALVECGANIVTVSDPSRVGIVIGDGHSTGHGLQVTWAAWLARVSPNATRLAEDNTMPLAPIAAAALAVAECFQQVLGELSATHRVRTLNLWDRTGTVTGPRLTRLPSEAWLVGLGHLGQAYAWCIRALPYADPTEVTFYLQDYDRVSDANHSTSVFVTDPDERRLKTRVVAHALETVGFQTRLVERPLNADQRRSEDEPGLALVGVDKLAPRRHLSAVGWDYTVDVGLGAGPTDFTGISLHTFPAAGRSSELAAWQNEPTTARRDATLEMKAYSEAGEQACGHVLLADKAVAVPFVGVVAACLAVAEPLRLLHGANPTAALAYDVGRLAPARAVTGECLAVPFAHVAALGI